ncbi:DUF3597 domain-containing protein [Luteimonas sp. MC1825]|uniref:DUF3597 domain-containing protein n=1 Tax=Luteimonas sp. MC1825 TaxID=2761107 RepID=UPI00161388B0|nr:DUF3597 domain-containing protein [Luteimonas sp. MC1825]MBB6598076.1 DUF3597 domain-containing protein [Luteimonas sp. MC1825]QOC88312.1 DUF3597 domain-containing protein [Luteimonas sp. MC1825]
MGLFSKIADRIFNRKADAPASASTGKPAPVIFEGSRNDPQVAPPALRTASAVTPTASAPAPVDVEAVLRDMADAKGGESDWRRSIVDLLKLLDLDSSLSARKELAAELGVDAGAHGSAEQNIALHKAVMRKLAENGGKVPADLRD